MEAITVELLEAKGACKGQVSLFRKLKPDMTVESAVKFSKQFNFDWAARNLLSEKGRQTYTDAKEPLLRAYTDAKAPLWQAYMDAIAPLLQTYKDAEAPLLQAYEDAKARIFATVWLSGNP